MKATADTLVARCRPKRHGPPSLGKIFGSTVPPELLRTARKRVGRISLFILVVTLATLPVAAALNTKELFRETFFVTPAHFISLVCLTSAAMFAATRFKQFSNQRLLDLALVYEVILAFGAGFIRHAAPWTEEFARDWSEVAVWIIVFSVLVPNAKWKTALAALVAGLMDPLGLFLASRVGLPMPSVEMMGTLFGPTFFAVVLSIFLSRAIFKLGYDIEEAKQLGNYQLVERLGKGGMGEVWRAEHGMLARPAAIKLIPPELLAGIDAHTAQRRFEREAKATALLESSHTIRLYDFGMTDDGVFFYVMEYLDGLDLDALVERFGPIKPERVVHLLRQVCESLEEAHRAGLIHRDVKPANIYVCRRGIDYDVIKVLDFGLAKWSAGEEIGDAKLTIDGGIAGTPAFIAPEVVLGERDIDSRADIYALGCVAFWMLTGRLVFEEATPMKVLVAHANKQPPSLSSLTELDIPFELEAIVSDCLRKNPDHRPQTAYELSERLATVSFDRPWSPKRAENWWRKVNPEGFSSGVSPSL